MTSVLGSKKVRIAYPAVFVLAGLLVGPINALASPPPCPPPGTTLPPGSTCSDSCIQDQAARKLQCTANDIRVKQVRATTVVDGCSCNQATDPNCTDMATFQAMVDIQSNASQRFDIGAYIATDGGNARTGECTISSVPFSPDPFANLDNDSCGDVSKPGAGSVDIGEITVECIDRDGDGFLDLGACTSWRQNDNTVCSGPQDAFPGSPSKCNCNIVNVEIPIVPVTPTPTSTVVPPTETPTATATATVTETPVGPTATPTETPVAPTATPTPTTTQTPSCAPQTQATGDARAFGVSLDLGGSPVITPVPDSDDTNPGDLALVQLPPPPDSPQVVVDLLHVEESTSSSATESSASAKATTAHADVIDSGGGVFVVSAEAVTAQVSCSANQDTASCSSAGSKLENVSIPAAGITLDEVTSPTEIEVTTPLGKGVVKLLEEIPSGANAGVEQPHDNANSSGLAINAIHVTITTPAGELLELIVGHAEASTSFHNTETCDEAPSVSGDAFIVGADVNETPPPPTPATNVVHARVGEVTLPSAGGTDDAIVKQIGPIAGMDTTLVASGTGESHTTGQIDDSNNTANSTSLARVEKLDVLANSSVPGGELIEARVVESACESSATSSGSASSGNAEILGLKIAGNNVCTGLMIDPACTPEPNTDLPLLPMGTLLRLNEQYCDGGTPTPAVTPSCTGPNASGITVNAIHIFIVGENNPLGLPVGADVVISHAHCDTKKVP